MARDWTSYSISPHCLALCLDKSLAKKLVEGAGIRTPKWYVIRKKEDLYRVPESFPFPAIIKPVFEGSSKGIHNNSLVVTLNRAANIVNEMLQRYRQPVMLEEFIEGDEVTVGLTGNSAPQIVGMMRILPRKKGRPFVYSLEVKRDWERLVDYECPALLEKKVIDRI
ncbi:MAG: D-alanine--D-alanine ligase, partial [Dehalococcoidia bacterium]